MGQRRQMAREVYHLRQSWRRDFEAAFSGKEAEVKSCSSASCLAGGGTQGIVNAECLRALLY